MQQWAESEGEELGPLVTPRVDPQRRIAGSALDLMEDIIHEIEPVCSHYSFLVAQSFNVATYILPPPLFLPANIKVAFIRLPLGACTAPPTNAMLKALLLWHSIHLHYQYVNSSVTLSVGMFGYVKK